MEIRNSNKGLQHLVCISCRQKPELRLRRHALIGAWLRTVSSLPRASGPKVTPMKSDMNDNQQFKKTVMKPVTFDGTGSWID